MLMQICVNCNNPEDVAKAAESLEAVFDFHARQVSNGACASEKCASPLDGIVAELKSANHSLVGAFDLSSLRRLIAVTQSLIAKVGPNLDTILSILSLFGYTPAPQIVELVKLIFAVIAPPTPTPTPDNSPSINVNVCSAPPFGAELVGQQFASAIAKIGDRAIIDRLKKVDWEKLIALIMTFISVMPKEEAAV